jgi:2'-hydroxyisoflavone reductase
VKLLVLGGTVFLGRPVVEAAIARGDEVTLFTRGRTNPELYPEVEHLVGDRDGDLRALEGREWDAVVDTSGFVPRVVRQSAELLRDAVGRYVFVSSVSAYDEVREPPDESAPLAELANPESEDVMRDYGALKAACEDVVRDVYGDRATIVRPGLIVGPYDPTDRFTYWPRRLADGGRVLVPAPEDAPVQIIDVRDLGEWLVRLAADGPGGAFNAVGPGEPLTFGGMVEACRRVVNPDAELVWVDGARLLEAGLKPWADLPVWLPGDEYAGMLRTPLARAVEAGLRFRPLEETIRDTLAWYREAGGDAPPSERYTSRPLDPAREAELLAELA